MKEKAYNDNLKELSWEKVREDIAKINPEFTRIIDEINPDKKHTVFKTRYFYGDEILKRAKLYIPYARDELLAIDDQKIDSHVQESLSYNLKSNPVLMLLNNSAEVFLSLESHTVPISDLIKPGRVFGAYRVLITKALSYHPAFIWDMTSGARSIFMLAKISNAAKHNRIKREFSLISGPPKNFFNHWKVFKELFNSENFSQNWFTDVIYFTAEWFKHYNDKAWEPFYNYLFKTAWDSSDYWRNFFFWNMVFSLFQNKIESRSSSYAISTVKHLLAIATGEAAGFVPAIDDIAAPVKELQRIYKDIYNIEYFPIMMHPGTISDSSAIVYYSLPYPTMLEFWQKPRDRDSFIDELFEVRGLLNNYIRFIISDEFNTAMTPFYEAVQKVKYEYFHMDITESFINIQKEKEGLFTDPYFKQFSCEEKLKFPLNSAFFKGCIRISKMVKKFRG